MHYVLISVNLVQILIFSEYNITQRVPALRELKGCLTTTLTHVESAGRAVIGWRGRMAARRSPIG